MMKKILMTGADGYIGSHLKPYLESHGFEVESYIGDICEFDIDADKIPDLVIHLAALTGVRKSLENPEEYYRVNVEGTREVFFICNSFRVPVIFASSSSAKFICNPYGETKAINETDRLENSIGIRPHTVYPGRPDMLFQNLLKNNVEYINGSHYRDFTHINDLCSAVLTIIQNYDILVGMVVDIGSADPVSVLKVAQAMGFNGEVRYEEVPSEAPFTEAHIEPLKELGWEPKVNIFTVIQELKKEEELSS